MGAQRARAQTKGPARRRGGAALWVAAERAHALVRRHLGAGRIEAAKLAYADAGEAWYRARDEAPQAVPVERLAAVRHEDMQLCGVLYPPTPRAPVDGFALLKARMTGLGARRPAETSPPATTPREKAAELIGEARGKPADAGLLNQWYRRWIKKKDALPRKADQKALILAWRRADTHDPPTDALIRYCEAIRPA